MSALTSGCRACVSGDVFITLLGSLARASSRVQLKGVGHATFNANGDLVVVFERFSITCK